MNYFEQKRLADYLANGKMTDTMDESLEEHDQKFHGGHFDPNSMSCNKRSQMAGKDAPDNLLPRLDTQYAGGKTAKKPARTGAMADAHQKNPVLSSLIETYFPREQYGNLLDTAYKTDSRPTETVMQDIADIGRDIEYNGQKSTPQALLSRMNNSGRFSPQMQSFDPSQAAAQPARAEEGTPTVKRRNNLTNAKFGQQLHPEIFKLISQMEQDDDGRIDEYIQKSLKYSNMEVPDSEIDQARHFMNYEKTLNNGRSSYYSDVFKDRLNQLKNQGGK